MAGKTSKGQSTPPRRSLPRSTRKSIVKTAAGKKQEPGFAKYKDALMDFNEEDEDIDEYDESPSRPSSNRKREPDSEDDEETPPRLRSRMDRNYPDDYEADDENADTSQPSSKRKREPDSDDDEETPLMLLRPRSEQDPHVSKGIEKLSRPSLKKCKLEKRDCDICVESKNVSAKNFPIFPSCEHAPSVCTDCYRNQIRTNINADRAGWDSCTCPLCTEPIEAVHAAIVLPKVFMKEMNTTINKARKEAAHDFMWCPSKGCGHGQTHKKPKAEYVSCSKCRTRICYKHQIPWHTNLTCQEYDDAMDQDIATRKAQEELRRTTKPCPHCQARTEKSGGCNHMTCGHCRKQWIWNDVPFDGEEVGTTAEVAGGRNGAPPLHPHERQYVDQVIRAENARIDHARQPLAEIQWTGFAGLFGRAMEDLRDGIRNIVEHRVGLIAPVAPPVPAQNAATLAPARRRRGGRRRARAPAPTPRVERMEAEATSNTGREQDMDEDTPLIDRPRREFVDLTDADTRERPEAVNPAQIFIDLTTDED